MRTAADNAKAKNQCVRFNAQPAARDLDVYIDLELIDPIGPKLN